MQKFNPNIYAYLENDSAMIQAAVDEAAKTGAKVTIPRYNARTLSNIWEITKAIRLHTGSVICLDNCYLRQADDVYENIFINSNQGTPLGYTREGRQYDIHVYGLGNAVLDGGKHNGLREFNHSKDGRPHIHNNCMFNFLNVERLSVENLRIINHRYWAFVHHYCTHGRISNINFYVPVQNMNQDGINLRTGCSHFIIENITGCTGDDTVALTNLYSCHDKPIREAGYDNSIHNVIIRNVQSCTRYSQVRLLNHYGKKIYNIVVENVMEDSESDYANLPGYESLHPEMDSLRVGACVRIGGDAYHKEGAKVQLTDTYNITVRNVVSQGRIGIKADCALCGGLFDNIRMYGKGGTAVYFGDGEIKNVVISNIIYPPNLFPNETDDNRREGPYNQEWDVKHEPDREICAVYFKNVTAENIVVDNLMAGENLTSVFGGNGKADVRTSNVIRYGVNTALNTGEQITLK
ncbi:MAG TPA: hypothetical protein DIW17_00500 [Clostridiales bacterium]|nr:hypothetical protein [Clostridiales bacterium]